MLECLWSSKDCNAVGGVRVLVHDFMSFWVSRFDNHLYFGQMIRGYLSREKFHHYQRKILPLFGFAAGLDQCLSVSRSFSEYAFITERPALVQIENMDALFEAQFSPLSETGRMLSKCGKCLRYMKYISMQPSRLYCATCEEVYYVPQKGTIKVNNQYVFEFSSQILEMGSFCGLISYIHLFAKVRLMR